MYKKVNSNHFHFQQQDVKFQQVKYVWKTTNCGSRRRYFFAHNNLNQKIVHSKHCISFKHQKSKPTYLKINICRMQWWQQKILCLFKEWLQLSFYVAFVFFYFYFLLHITIHWYKMRVKEREREKKRMRKKRGESFIFHFCSSHSSENSDIVLSLCVLKSDRWKFWLAFVLALDKFIAEWGIKHFLHIFSK